MPIQKSMMPFRKYYKKLQQAGKKVPQISNQIKKTKIQGKAADQELLGHADQTLSKIIPSNQEVLTLNQRTHAHAHAHAHARMHAQNHTHTQPSPTAYQSFNKQLYRADVKLSSCSRFNKNYCFKAW